MKTAIVCITKHGLVLARQIKEKLSAAGEAVDLYSFYQDNDNSGAAIKFSNLSEITKQIFQSYRQIVFVMALGIVVRVIAAHIKDKYTDPAVVVIDEAGQNVISVLSGHLGGANKLTNRIANFINARPIITTATDVQGKPAVDNWAREYNLAMDPVTAAKKVNSTLVNGGTVHIFGGECLGIATSLNIQHFDLSVYQNYCHLADYNVVVTNRIMSCSDNKTMFLRPRNIVAGIGCRSGIPEEKLLEAIKNALQLCNRSILSLRAIATIIQKAKEPGLIRAASALKIPVIAYKSEEINEFILNTKVQISHSDFVRKNVGVPAVCEPAALMATRKGELLLPKQIFQGITVAVAEEPLQ